MSATEFQFRGVAFGGFNRQDVLTYLEGIFADHNRETLQLKQALKAAEERCSQQETELTEAQTRNGWLEEQHTRLTADLEDVQGKLAEQSAACAELSEKVKQLEPGAEAYACIKERAATIELEAHLRAEKIVEQAETQAKANRERMEAWLHRVQADYERLRTDVDGTISHVSGELVRIQKNLDTMASEFTMQDEALAALFDCKPETEKQPEAY